jgi:endonuclease/exonuclease/phosphatase (EEP) superfamily protein YafD
MLQSTVSNSVARRAILGTVALLLAACASVPKEDHLLTSASGASAPAPSVRAAVNALRGGNLRVLCWNIHKAADAGLYSDLARLAAQHDLLLLQEAVLDEPLRALLEREGFSWQMADAFGLHGLTRGVLVAARVPPLDGRELRAFEPLFPIPKSAIVTHFRLAGRPQPLAVVNLHAINFSPGVAAFRAQLDAIARELQSHDEPIIFAGDFNTWSERRYDELRAVMNRLGLVEIELRSDERRRAFRHHLDHLFVRGFSVVDASSPKLKSSDHNPLLVRLAVQPARGRR